MLLNLSEKVYEKYYLNKANQMDKDVITKSMVLDHFKGFNSANKVRFVA